MGRSEDVECLKVRARPETRFDGLLPDAAIVVEATADDWEQGLTADERPHVIHATAKRVREFTAGRNCARRALHHAGRPAPSILVGSGRAPLFPNGYAGTITHTDEYCAAAVLAIGACVSIGIDAEPNEPLGEDLVKSIALEREQSMLAALSKDVPANWGKILFAAKESFFKAWFPIGANYLEFQDVSVKLDPSGYFCATLIAGDSRFAGTEFRGRFRRSEDLLLAAMTIYRSDIERIPNILAELAQRCSCVSRQSR